MTETELRKYRARVATRKSRYGITEKQYNDLLIEQGMACAVCKAEFNDTLWPNVDHDHNCCPGRKSCGKCLRGLLCSECLTLASIMETRFKASRKYMDDMFLYLTKYLSEVK